MAPICSGYSNMLHNSMECFFVFATLDFVFDTFWPSSNHCFVLFVKHKNKHAALVLPSHYRVLLPNRDLQAVHLPLPLMCWSRLFLDHIQSLTSNSITLLNNISLEEPLWTQFSRNQLKWVCPPMSKPEASSIEINNFFERTLKDYCKKHGSMFHHYQRVFSLFTTLLLYPRWFPFVGGRDDSRLLTDSAWKCCEEAAAGSVRQQGSNPGLS